MARTVTVEYTEDELRQVDLALVARREVLEKRAHSPGAIRQDHDDLENANDAHRKTRDAILSLR